MQSGAQHSPLRAAGVVGTALAVGVAMLAFTNPAQALNDARTGPVDARGFPEFYTGDSGLTLDLCEDGTANCLAAVEGDLVAPDGEGFYWMATATLPTSRGTLNVEFALEAAFGDTGEPEVFDRLRVRGNLSRAGTYTLQHPYGSTRITAADPSEQRNVNLTEDLLCALGPGGACGGHIDSWLRSVNPTVGYLGGGETLSRVTGGTARNNLVLRAPNGRVIGRTGQFAIVGKLAPGPQAAISAADVDFGNTLRTRRRSITVTNLGDSALTFDNIRLAGASTISLSPTGCAAPGRSVASGGSCRVNLVYRPKIRRISPATLVINDNTFANVHRVGVEARTTSVLAARSRMHFAPRRVGADSPKRRIVVENDGVRRLRIRSVSLSGGNRQSFERRSGQGPLCRRGTSLRPGRACAIYVAFAPKSFGLKRTSVRIRSNALSNPDLVRLNGRGR